MIDATALLLAAALSLDTTAPSPTATDTALASVVSPLIQPGDRLRVRTGFGTTEGVAASAGLGGLQLRATGEGRRASLRPTAWSEIERIERVTRPAGAGAKVGAAFGALLGLATVMSAAASFESAGGHSGDVLLAGLVGGIAGGCAGALVGGIVDAGIPRWKTVYERR